MRLERSCSSAAGICHQHRSLHFHKSLSVQIFTDSADDFGTFNESILYFRIHDKIHISLTITDICIGQTMKFFRQYLQTLGKQSYRSRMDRNFTCFCLKYFTGNTHDIADIHFLKCFVFLFSNTVSCHVRLNISLQILHITEGSFTHHTFGHHTSCDGNCLSFIHFKVFSQLCTVISYIVLCDLKRIFSVFLQFCQFFPANLQ